MWTTLITVIQKRNKNAVPDSFLASVKNAGIRVVELEEEMICGLPGDENLRQPFPPQKFREEEWLPVRREEALVLTDIPEVADVVKKAGIALAGLEYDDSCPVYAAPYVIQGLEDIDTDYLQMVYKRFHGEPLEIARTEHLCIRELVSTEKEAESFIRLAREAGFVISGLPETGDRQAEQEFLKAYIRGQYALYEYGIWAVTDRKNGELIGIAGVEARESEEGKYLELGYAIEEKWRGQGLAKEAGNAIIHFLKEKTEIRGKIKCFVPKENIASQKTAQSIGMLQTEDILNEFYTYERVL